MFLLVKFLIVLVSNASQSVTLQPRLHCSVTEIARAVAIYDR